jgi:S1-C subfamily serine protease
MLDGRPDDDTCFPVRTRLNDRFPAGARRRTLNFGSEPQEPSMNDALSHLSDALRERAIAAQSIVVAIRNEEGRHISGILWQDDVVVTSEQSMAERDSYSIVTHGDATTGRIVGRDRGTNVLALRTERPMKAQRPGAADAGIGALVMAFGTASSGGSTARLGVVNAVGPEWHSRAGGRIDARISLDIRLAGTEEGGPVLDAQGTMLGMSTFGVRGEVLVIPSATIDRVLPQLLAEGQVRRGWLGLGLQPVAIPDALRDSAGATYGMMVMSIDDNGPGAKAGVTAGDVVLTLNGTAMHRRRQLAAQLDAEHIGQTVELRVIRGGQIVPLQLEIGPRPTT